MSIPVLQNILYLSRSEMRQMRCFELYEINASYHLKQTATAYSAISAYKISDLNIFWNRAK